MYWRFVSGPLGTMKQQQVHEPVMAEEVLEVLPLRPGAIVFDGTLGLGGHSRMIAERVAPNGVIVGFDWDESMLMQAKASLMEVPNVKFEFRYADYREIPAVAEELGLQPDAILLDLGLNSAQIEDPSRGISFRDVGPLDMRMDRGKGEPASSALNRLTPGQIEEILEEYGDERWARAIAKVIVDYRKEQPLRTTQDLVDCVLAAIPPKARDRHIHPATRTFQAIRIYVNNELENLEEAIESIAKTLAPGGVIAVLSYHSGEDRAAKFAFRNLAASHQYAELMKKPKLPTDGEIRRNPRSRSAKLRALKKNDRSQI